MENTGLQEASGVATAQRLRLRRILGGCAAYTLTVVIVACSWLSGYLEGERAVHFLLAVVAINGTAVVLVLTNLNLRLPDPSLTAPLIIASLWPSIYVMYYLEEPMLRAPFLLMATVAMLFAALAYDLRRMLQIGGIVLISYLLMLLTLYHFAPQRLDLRVEIVIVLAYTMVLVQIAFLGSFIAGLRERLREKNVSLMATMAELEELATRDPLTRLPNRRTAMMRLERELSRNERRRRGGHGLCIALLDVDHFKRVNDRFGHQAGDEVLRRVGETLSNAMRQGDFVARFGGEEFLIILPETTLEDARKAVERIRAAVAALRPGELPVSQPLTVSIGVAAHEPGRRVEETLGYADQALYRAKRLGRNQVALWAEPLQEALP